MGDRNIIDLGKTKGFATSFLSPAVAHDGLSTKIDLAYQMILTQIKICVIIVFYPRSVIWQGYPANWQHEQ
jgi:hypothetical protein